jgi:hypothetical protein
MTDKRTLTGIGKIKDSIENKDFSRAFRSSKTIIDNLVLNSHYRIFKRKPLRKPLYPIKQVEGLLRMTRTKPETKKIIEKKTFKQILKWYAKYQIFISDPQSKIAKNPTKFANKTLHVIQLLNMSAVKIKTNLSK